MTKFQVVVKTEEGENQYQTTADSVQMVTAQLDAKYQNQNVSYSIQNIPEQNQIAANQVPQLINASFGLFGCLVILIVADFKLRKWLKA